MTTICMKCKRFIDKSTGRGYGPGWLGCLWQLVDNRLSHGLCPECHVEYQKELAQYRQEERG